MLNRKIPTVLGLLFLVFAIGATVFGATTIRQYVIRASPQTVPQNIRITNITDTSFVVSYTTAQAISGSLVFSDGKSFSEGQDSFLHYISVNGLKPATKYQFKISGDDINRQLTTSSIIPVASSLAEPIYGTVSKPDGSPAVGAIVYLEIPLASPLSSQVKGNGNFLVPVNNLRSSDLTSLLIPQGGDPEDIIVEGGVDGQSTLNCFFGKDKPVPNIILGKNSSCQKTDDSVLKPSFIRSPTEVTILSPKDQDTVSTGLPTFRGTAPPEKIIQIEIHSESPVVSSFRSSSDGTWSWTPPANLSPGQHTITVSYMDDLNKPIKIVRSFVVEAAGSQNPILPQVVATPSAQPVIISPPPIIASPSAIIVPPVTGSVLDTLLFLTAGLFLVTLGIGLIRRSVIWI